MREWRDIHTQLTIACRQQKMRPGAQLPDEENYQGVLGNNVVTIATLLESSGYHTYMAGKWHLGDEKETIPHARGFEETFALLPGGGSHWHDRKPVSPPETMIYSRNGEPVESLPDDFYSTRFYTDVLLEFLEGRVANWWKPDDVLFVEELPKTSVGKFNKRALREQFAS